MEAQCYPGGVANPYGVAQERPSDVTMMTGVAQVPTSTHGPLVARSSAQDCCYDWSALPSHYTTPMKEMEGKAPEGTASRALPAQGSCAALGRDTVTVSVPVTGPPKQCQAPRVPRRDAWRRGVAFLGKGGEGTRGGAGRP